MRTSIELILKSSERKKVKTETFIIVKNGTFWKKCNIFDIIDLILKNKKQYSIISFKVNIDGMNVINSENFIALENIINHIYYYMVMLNGKKFSFSLEDLFKENDIKNKIKEFDNI